MFCRCKVCMKFYSYGDYAKRCIARHREVIDLDEQVQSPLSPAVMRRIDINQHFLEEHKELNKVCCCICLQVGSTVTEIVEKKEILRRLA